jgi:hypothetical protein
VVVVVRIVVVIVVERVRISYSKITTETIILYFVGLYIIARVILCSSRGSYCRSVLSSKDAVPATVAICVTRRRTSVGGNV